ncbi:hypothetical protein HPB49_013379 [Dermacentor silvarum]|uniref:Uncharacterized protein n=1 Tax=Dermacentor silvarum TaxID=543639 RepID=A0ACB8C3U4_DERSI|nr:hypothetical protein HPB49_013379 [Dermacentor silvarum]
MHGSYRKHASSQRVFRKQWLDDLKLQDSIAPSENSSQHSTCKYCSCKGRAHYTDLIKDSETRKHRNAFTPGNQLRLKDTIAHHLTADAEQKQWALKISLFTACHIAINSVDEVIPWYRQDCIDRNVSQYKALRLHFATISDINYNVSLLRDMYEDERNLANLTFLAPILANLKRVNRLFQGRYVNPIGVFEELEKAFK